MPTTYNDQGYPVDAFNLTVPQVLTYSSITLNDQNDDGFIDTNDTVNGTGITAVYRGDTITVDGTTITGATIYLSDGGRIFVATDGNPLINGTATSSTWVTTSTNIDVNTLAPICFAKGTRLRGAAGDVPVEHLKVGDLVMTLDHGLKPVRWIGRKSTPGTGIFAPVEISAGALGNTRTLTVSQQHRVLLRGAAAEILFGVPEVLAAAKHLVNGTTIRLAPRAEIEYFHILLDDHEVLYAEDALCESFHPGSYALEADDAMRAELEALFPELSASGFQTGWVPSRTVLKSHEARTAAAALVR